MANGRRVQITIDVEATGAREELARLRGVFPRLEADAVESVRAAENAFGSLGPIVSQNVQQSSNSLQSLNKASSSANQFMFSLADGFQDAAAAGGDMGNAVRFAGNNLAFAAEIGANLVTQTGSMRGAMSALAGSLLGVGGVIVAVQVLVSALPALIDAMSDSTEEAERMKEALEEAAGAVFQLRQASIGEVGIADAQRLRERYQAQTEALREQIDIQEQIRGLEGTRGQATAAAVREARRLREEYGRMSDEELAQLRQDFNDVDALLGQANEQLEAFRLQMRLLLEQRGTLLPGSALEFEQTDFIGQMEDVSVELLSWSELVQQANDPLLTAWERTGELREQVEFLQSAEGQRVLAIERQNERLQQQIEFTRELGRRGTLMPTSAFGAQESEDRVLGGDRVTFDPIEELLNPESRIALEAQNRLQQLRTAMEQGLITPSEQAQQATAALEQSLMQMITNGVDPASEEFQRLRQEWQEAEAEAENLEKQTGETSAVMESQMVSAANRVGQALISAFRGGEDAGKQLLSTVISIGTRLGASAIGGPGGVAFSLLGGLFQGGFHAGTDYYPGGVGLVGERGPELVELPRGSRIHSNEETQRLMQRAPSRTDALQAEIRGLRQALYDNPPRPVLDTFALAEEIDKTGVFSTD